MRHQLSTLKTKEKGCLVEDPATKITFAHCFKVINTSSKWDDQQYLSID